MIYASLILLMYATKIISAMIVKAKLYQVGCLTQMFVFKQVFPDIEWIFFLRRQTVNVIVAMDALSQVLSDFKGKVVFCKPEL